jgi:hypothetical protein
MQKNGKKKQERIEPVIEVPMIVKEISNLPNKAKRVYPMLKTKSKEVIQKN